LPSLSLAALNNQYSRNAAKGITKQVSQEITYASLIPSSSFITQIN